MRDGMVTVVKHSCKGMKIFIRRDIARAVESISISMEKSIVSGLTFV
jgi:hypothetical protein